MFWVFVPREQIGPDGVVFTGAKAHHLARVLRVRPGESGVAVSDGREYHLEIASVRPEHVQGRIIEAKDNTSESPVRVTLLQALLPNPDFDAVIEGATATGVSRILPVTAARSVAHPAPARIERWRAIAESAAEQSRRGRVPEVAKPASLADAIQSVGVSTLLALHPEATARLQPAARDESTVALAVGPEGGWTPGEIDYLVEAGATPVTLGPRILRARLAAAIATAILIHQA
jgi:16S rRNA (uracil1498-N3)-methyltransferase